MSPCTSVMDVNTASPTSSPTSGHAETSPVSPSNLSVSSSLVKKELREWTRTRLQVQMVSAPGSRRPVQNSYVGFYSTPSTLAWVRRMFLCCGRHPASFQYLKNLIHLPSVTTDQLPSKSHVMKVLQRQLVAYYSRQINTSWDPL